jgi:CRP-like cAMP-binding protein
LTHRLSLLKRDQPIDNVYFPEGGVCSLTTSMTDGSAVEVATVGREGMVGFELFIGSPIATVDAFVQVPGPLAYSLPTATFRREIDTKGALFDAVARYSHALLGQIVQTAACNRLHKVPARAARWLLLTHDRVDSNDFPLSHEFLSIRSRPRDDRGPGRAGHRRVRVLSHRRGPLRSPRVGTAARRKNRFIEPECCLANRSARRRITTLRGPARTARR